MSLLLHSTTGYCNKRNDCPFIHDSRRVAICRKFLRSECSDPNCLLSHTHDQVGLRLDGPWRALDYKRLRGERALIV